MTRVALALVASLALAVAGRAADLPTGTWAVNVDGNKGDLVIKEVKDGKVSGVLLNTDFTGTWSGKELKFESGGQTYEAQLVREPGEKGLTKYTLTGTRSVMILTPNRAGREIHVNKTGGWYAQLSAEAPAVGEIKAEARGVLVYNKDTAYVLVKRTVGTKTQETRVWVGGAEDTRTDPALAALDGKEVVVTGGLALTTSRARDSVVPFGSLYFLSGFEIKAANPKK